MRPTALDREPWAEHVLGMSRRKFLSLVAGAVAAESVARSGWAGTPPSAAKAPQTTQTPKIRGICFDLFTIFDPRSVARAAEAFAPGRGQELWNTWKVRQFEYSWLRASARRYVDFEIVTGQALAYAATELKIALSAEARRQLVGAYSELDPWPDTRAALLAWKQQGMKLAPLANYSPKMIRQLLARNGLEGVFDTLISTDAAQTYKPDARAYALGPARLGLSREQLAFSAFGGWDAAGAKWFGFPTFWLNRLNVTAEQLVLPDATGSDLADLARWLESR
ncbi:MAG TPA: haloacid dehalogenase type II [Polyangiaceae bacterium]|nr:haloacid dehalogenase type II [Polyangiaceae bacterium]